MRLCTIKVYISSRQNVHCIYIREHRKPVPISSGLCVECCFVSLAVSFTSDIHNIPFYFPRHWLHSSGSLRDTQTPCWMSACIIAVDKSIWQWPRPCVLCVAFTSPFPHRVAHTIDFIWWQRKCSVNYSHRFIVVNNNSNNNNLPSKFRSFEYWTTQ